MKDNVNLEDLTFEIILNLENSLNKEFPIDCLGTEISFAQNQRRADIVVISKNNHLIGFEIKSDYDSLSRLSSQIDDYKKSFDYTYVVVTSKYFDNVLSSNIDKSVGLLLYKDSKVSIVRKAKKTSYLKKDYLISLIDKNDFNYDIFDKLLIKELAIQSLKKKLSPMYKDFKENFVPPYNKDHLLSFKKNQSLKYYLGL